MGEGGEEKKKEVNFLGVFVAVLGGADDALISNMLAELELSNCAKEVLVLVTIRGRSEGSAAWISES